MTRNEIVTEILKVQEKYHTPTSKIAGDCDIDRSILSKILNDSLDRNVTDDVYMKLSQWLKDRKV